MRYKVKKIRERKGISQDELSRKSKVSRTVISRLENEEDPEVKVGTLKAIADTLGTTVPKLFNY